MAAPLRLTVLITALTRLLLDVLTVRAPHLPSAARGPGPAHAVGPARDPATRPPLHPHRRRPVAGSALHSGPAEPRPAHSRARGARMTDPTPTPGAEPHGREETRPFAAPAPPQHPRAAEPAGPGPAAARAAGARATRRSKVVTGAAAAGLLAVGVAVGVVVGQATAGWAAADTGSSTVTVPDDGGSGRYGTPPDGGMHPGGGPGDIAPPDGSTDDG